MIGDELGLVKRSRVDCARKRRTELPVALSASQ